MQPHGKMRRRRGGAAKAAMFIRSAAFHSGASLSEKRAEPFGSHHARRFWAAPGFNQQSSRTCGQCQALTSHAPARTCARLRSAQGSLFGPCRFPLGIPVAAQTSCASCSRTPSRPALEGFLTATSGNPAATTADFPTPACLPFRTSSGPSPLEAGARKLGAVFVDRKRAKRFPRFVHAKGCDLPENGREKSPGYAKKSHHRERCRAQCESMSSGHAKATNALS
jgi:hypothetical protein